LRFGLAGFVVHQTAGTAAGVSGCVEDDVLAARDFIDRGDPIGVGFKRLVPEDLAGVFVIGADGALAASGEEDQSSGGDDRPLRGR
jgi:hypothetical protein